MRSLVLWLMICVNDHPPPDVALRGGVRMMVLRREDVTLCNSNFPMTPHAPINACMWCCGARTMIFVERCIGTLFEILAFLIESHLVAFRFSKAGLDLYAESESPPIVACNAAASPIGAVLAKRGPLDVEAVQGAFSRIGCKIIAGVLGLCNPRTRCARYPRSFPVIHRAFETASNGRAKVSWASRPSCASV